MNKIKKNIFVLIFLISSSKLLFNSIQLLKNDEPIERKGMVKRLNHYFIDLINSNKTDNEKLRNFAEKLLDIYKPSKENCQPGAKSILVNEYGNDPYAHFACMISNHKKVSYFELNPSEFNELIKILPVLDIYWIEDKYCTIPTYIFFTPKGRNYALLFDLLKNEIRSINARKISSSYSDALLKSNAFIKGYLLGYEEQNIFNLFYKDLEEFNQARKIGLSWIDENLEKINNNNSETKK